MGNAFFTKSYFFRFLDQKQISSEFEKEIQSLDEAIGGLKSLKGSVETQADEHGQFIYRTTILLLKNLQKAYRAELSRING